MASVAASTTSADLIGKSRVFLMVIPNSSININKISGLLVPIDRPLQKDRPSDFTGPLERLNSLNLSRLYP
jgi:hypothetical protein